MVLRCRGTLGRQRTGGAELRGRRRHHPRLLVAEESRLAGVGIDGAERQARRGDPEPVGERRARDPAGVAHLLDIRAVRPSIFILSYISVGETAGLLTDGAGQPLDIYFRDASGNPIKNPNWNSY